MNIEELSNRLGLPYIDSIDEHDAQASLVSKLPLNFARNRQVLPLREQNGRIVVATSNPSDLAAIDELKGLFGIPVSMVAVSSEVLNLAINRAYSHISGSAQEVVTELAAEDLSVVASELAEPRDLLEQADEAPIIRLLHAILFQAVKERASDIHIEPFERTLNVRFRIDGILYRKLAPPRQFHDALVSRVKIMALLDIAEKRLPQDGRFRVLVAGNEVDIRVSIIPASFGERVVLRLLDKRRGIISLEGMGLDHSGVKSFDKLLSRTSGIILVTGPTGSGKTTTLYAALNRINAEEKNLLTIEDPVEYQVPGVGQIQVNSKINLTFATGLRSILRQDPDIVMVGEIRDTETSEIAIQASLTGHLVLSTLHTNDSVSAVTRLIDMGIEPFLVSSSISAVLAQRLVRTICPHCRETYTDHRSEEFGLPEKLFRGHGCTRCNGLGMLGRTGIFELLLIDSELCSMITRRCPSSELRDYARLRGMKTLREDGICKVSQGITTLEEVLRVTQEEYAEL